MRCTIVTKTIKRCSKYHQRPWKCYWPSLNWKLELKTTLKSCINQAAHCSIKYIPQSHYSLASPWNFLINSVRYCIHHWKSLFLKTILVLKISILRLSPEFNLTFLHLSLFQPYQYYYTSFCSLRNNNISIVNS